MIYRPSLCITQIPGEYRINCISLLILSILLLDLLAGNICACYIYLLGLIKLKIFQCRSFAGNICACHIHLLLSRPGNLGGAEDWLVRSLARKGAQRFGRKHISFLAKRAKKFIFPLLSNCLQGSPSVGHKHLCLAILGCFQLQLLAPSPATPLSIHLLVISTSYD